jgi:ribA/ribD-fused uncharacterized protein
MSEKETVYGFVGNYAFCTNFYKADVVYEGILYPSTEHAYQAAKSLDPQFRLYVANVVILPGQAKHAGNNKLENQAVPCVLRKDWDDIKIQVMEDVCRDKFTRHPKLMDMLLATGDIELVEYNTWRDHFWGKSFQGVGRNELGKVLMKLRHEFRTLKFIEE